MAFHRTSRQRSLGNDDQPLAGVTSQLGGVAPQHILAEQLQIVPTLIFAGLAPVSTKREATDQIQVEAIPQQLVKSRFAFREALVFRTKHGDCLPPEITDEIGCDAGLRARDTG